MPETDLYFQRLTLSDLLGRIFALYGSNFVQIIALSTFSFVPLVLLQAVQFGLTKISPTTGTSYVETHPAKGTLEIVVTILLSMAVLQIARGAMARYVGILYLRNTRGPPTVAECLKATCYYVGPLFGSYGLLVLVMVAASIPVLILQGIFIATIGPTGVLGLSIIMLVVYMAFAVFVGIRSFMFVPAIMIEKKGPIEALKRAWELSSYGTCFVLVALMIMGLISLVTTMLWQTITTPVAMDQTGPSFWTFVLQYLINLFLLPLGYLAETVLYLHFRVEREGITEDVLVQDITGSTPIFDSRPNVGSYQPVIPSNDAEGRESEVV